MDAHLECCFFCVFLLSPGCGRDGSMGRLGKRLLGGVVKTRLSVLQERLVMHGAALGRLLHIGVSGVCLLAVLGAVVLTEKAMVRVIKENLGRKPHTQ